MKKIIMILFLILFTFLICGFFFLRNSVDFSLIGSKNNTILVNTAFVDEGGKATLFDIDLSNKIDVLSNLNTAQVGEYYIKYKLNFLGEKYSLVRNISVIDDVAPEIILNGDKEIKLYVGDKYVEHGVIAMDNYDGDITSNVTISGNVDTSSAGEYKITYNIRDTSLNEAVVSRKVIVRKKSRPVVVYKSADKYDNDNSIIKYIKDNNYDVAFGYYNLVTGDYIYYNSNKIYYGASLIKTLDAIYLYDKKMVNNSLDTYVRKAISVSDNNAHNYLVNYIGLDKLRDYGIKLGAHNTLTGNDLYGSTTVLDQIIYLKKLYQLSLDNLKLKNYFINTYGNYLRIDNVDVMHKYGYYGKYFHDVGIILDEKPYLIVVLTKHGENLQAKTIINDISKLTFEYHNSKK